MQGLVIKRLYGSKSITCKGGEISMMDAGSGVGEWKVYIPSLSPDIKCIHSFLKDIIQTLSPIFIKRQNSPHKQNAILHPHRKYGRLLRSRVNHPLLFLYTFPLSNRCLPRLQHRHRPRFPNHMHLHNHILLPSQRPHGNDHRLRSPLHGD